MGDRANFLRRAKVLIGERIGPLTRQSAVVETPAWGNTDQGDFLNQVLEVALPGHWFGNDLTDRLHDLLDQTQAIERELGRERKTQWGPRTIDIDLIFLDDLRFESQRLSLPHPWWREREFVAGLLP